jgi:hypothetical protein
VTKARACKSAGQEGSPEVTFHAPGSAKKCEGMNLHTPNGIPTLEVGVPVDFQIFREQLQESKLIGLKHSLKKIVEHRCLKWAHMTHLDI